MLPTTMLNLVLVAALTLLVGGCATGPYRAQEGTNAPQTAAGTPLKSLRLGAPLEDRILARNPERISATDGRDTLAKAPAPRMLLIHARISPVYLPSSPFADFRARMGMPDMSVRRE